MRTPQCNPLLVVLRTAVLALLVCPAALGAQSPYPGIDEIARDSDLIVRAEVLETRSYWRTDERGKHIYTLVSLRPISLLTGELGGDDLALEVVGGTVGMVTESVSSSPVFRQGEDVLLFLKRDPLRLTRGRHAKRTVRDETVCLDGRTLSLEALSTVLQELDSHPEASLMTLIPEEPGQAEPAENAQPPMASEDVPPASAERAAQGAAPDKQPDDTSDSDNGTGLKRLQGGGQALLADPVQQTAGTWQTIFSDGFEGAFPGSWSLLGSPTWDDESYTSHNGYWSAYCVGSTVSPPGPYPNNANAWMIYGPFSLADATSAAVDFYYRNKSESGCDYFKWLASTNGSNFYGWQISGDQDSWRSKTFDLTTVPTLGNLCGQSQVWIAFLFKSDSSITDVGAFVDDVVVKKYVPVQPPTLVSSSCYVSPTTATPGSRLTVYYRIYNPNPSSLAVGLGCSIRLHGTSTWISDPDNDVYRDCPSGYSNQSRYFDIPADAQSGSYDVAWGLWETIGVGSAWDYLEKTNQFTVVMPDLEPYQPPGWDDKLVISNVTGTTTSAGTIYNDEDIYVDYSCVNSGDADAGHFRYGLYIDGALRKYVDKSSLAAGWYSSILDSNVGTLSAGYHTFEIKCDYNDEVAESDEGNNDYLRAFYITARPLPDLKGSTFDVPDSLTAADSFDVVFTIDNDGPATDGGFYVYFYISADGTISDSDRYLGSHWISGMPGYCCTLPLTKNLTLPPQDDSFYSHGDGTYYIGMIVDPDDRIDESDETNNRNRGEGIDREAVEIDETVHPTWIIMYYFAHGSGADLEGHAALKRDAIDRATANTRFQAFVCWDRVSSTDRVYKMRDGVDQSWTGPEIGLPAEFDMGDPLTLVTFVDWVLDNYQADHYALVLFDHGSGVAPTSAVSLLTVPEDPTELGVCWDSDPPGSYLSLYEVGVASDSIRVLLGRNLEILHFDACLMQMLETNYQCRNSVDYVVASENLGWAFGSLTGSWEDDYLEDVNAATSPQSLATAIAQAYDTACDASGLGHTVSTLAVSEIPTVASRLNDLANALVDEMWDVRPELATIRSHVQKFDSNGSGAITDADDYLDLKDLAIELYNRSSSSAVRNAANALRNAIGNEGGTFVKFEEHLSASGYDFSSGTYGVSVYWPDLDDSTYDNYIDTSSSGSQLALCVMTHWDEFLRACLEWNALKVTSSGASNVSITCTTDEMGHGNGATPFARVYEPGTNVSLTAPASASGEPFIRWERNGSYYSSNRTVSFAIDNDCHLNAVYGTHALSVSSSPEINVPIDVTPDPDSTTPFSRTYDHGTGVTLTAPQTHNGYAFVRWRLDGADQTAGQRGLSMTIDGDHGAVAVYQLQTHQLSVASSPEINVPIDVAPDPDGTTPFNRTYDHGTNVTLTAPQTHNGYAFVRWRLDGADQAAGQRDLNVTVDTDHAALATYSRAEIRVDDDGPGDLLPGDPSVSDPDEDGSAEHPYDAIQEGIDAVTAGGEVIVLSGTYAGAGNRDLDFGGKAITVRGQNGATNTIIDCGNAGRGFCFCSSETAASVVDGFTITNGYVSGTAHEDKGGGIYCEGSSPTILNCRFVSNTVEWCGGGIGCNASSSTITGCIFESNHAFHGGALDFDNSPATVTNCLIFDNEAESRGGGINCYGTIWPEIGNCTIARNSAAVGGGGIYCYVGAPVVTNSILWANSAPDGHEICILTPAGYNPTMLLRYNDVEGGQLEIHLGDGCSVDMDASNIDQDPLFASWGGCDYLLSQTAAGQASESPCVDTGSDTAANLGLDDQTTRTDGLPDSGVVDMGYHVPHTLWMTDVYWDQATASVVLTFTSKPGVGYTVEVAEADAYADGLTWSNLAARTATTDQTTVSDDLSTNALSSDYRFYRVKRDDGSEYSWQTAAVFELHLAVGFATRQFFVSTPLIPDTDHVGVEDVLGTQLDYAGVRMDKLIADSGLYSSATYDDVADTWTGGYSIVAGEGYWLKVGNAYPIPHTVRLTGYVPEETLRVSVARDSWAVSHRWIGYSMPRPTTLGALGLEAEVVPFWSSEVRLLPLGATAWNSYRWDGAKWYDVTNPGVDAGGTPIACGEGILFIHNAIAGEDDTLVWPTWYLHPPNTW